MSSNIYAIVSFDNNEVGVVPMQWLNKEKNQCWWPPHKSKDSGKIMTFVKHCLPPGENWMQYNIRVVGKASKLHEHI